MSQPPASQPTLYLSYASPGELSEAIDHALRNDSYLTTRSESSLVPEETLREISAHAIEKCDLFIGIYHSTFRQSLLVEYETARSQGKPILVLFVNSGPNASPELDNFWRDYVQRWDDDERHRALVVKPGPELISEATQLVRRQVLRFFVNGGSFASRGEVESGVTGVTREYVESGSESESGPAALKAAADYVVRRKIEEVGRVVAERGEPAAVNLINEPNWAARDRVLDHRVAAGLRENGYPLAARAAYQGILKQNPDDAVASEALHAIEQWLASDETVGSVPAGASDPNARPPAPDFTTRAAVEERMREAAKLAAGGEGKEAETLVSQLLYLAPDYGLIHAAAEELRRQGYLEGALRAYEKMVELDPDNYPSGAINSIQQELRARAEAAARQAETPADEAGAPSAEAESREEFSHEFVRVVAVAATLDRKLQLAGISRAALFAGLCVAEPQGPARVALSAFGIETEALLARLRKDHNFGVAGELDLRAVVAESAAIEQDIGRHLDSAAFTDRSDGRDEWYTASDGVTYRFRFSTGARQVLQDVVSRAGGHAPIRSMHVLKSLLGAEKEEFDWVERTVGVRELASIRNLLADWPDERELTREDVLRRVVRDRLFKNPPAQSDGASVVDLLGFKEHAEALVDIIRKDETKPPLVIGVYGPWGSGKSTFMGLVKAKLEGAKERKEKERAKAEERKNLGRLRFWSRHVGEQLRGVWSGLLTALRLRERSTPKLKIVTVEYDAWAYADTPKLWSGLVGKVAKELDAELGWWGRITYLWERRARKLLWAILLGLVPVAVFALAWINGQLKTLADTSGVNLLVVKLVALVVPAGTTARAVFFLRRPVTDAVTSLASRFDPTHAAGVVSRIQGEFKTALQTRIAPEADESVEKRKSTLRGRIERNELKIVVFIDELDRCPLERIVDILEAIKLFLAEDIFIVFLGVDTRVASEAIRLHYKEVQNPDLPREYLEKIVQLPLRVPTARGDSIRKFLENFMSVPAESDGGKVRAAKEGAPSTTPGGGSSGATQPPPSGQVTPNQPRPVVPAPPNGREGSFARLERQSLTPQPAPDPMPVMSVRTTNGEVDARQALASSALSSLPSLPDTKTELTFMAQLAEDFLEGNPRRMKRLLNTYRYVKILSSVAGKPVEDDEWQKRMLAWLAFTMKWPAFMERAIEVAEVRVAERKRAAESGASAKVAGGAPEEAQSFLGELVSERERRDEARPSQELIEHYLSFEAGAVVEHYELAGNFLVENPRTRPAAAAQKNVKAKSGKPGETPSRKRSVTGRTG